MRSIAFLGFATVASISCMRPSAEQRARSEAEATRAMNAFIDHAIELVPTIDDKISDASTVALALTNACALEYNAYTEATVNTIAKTPKGRRYYRFLRDSRDEKIQASLQIVLSYRAGKLKTRQH
jgi:hypothetical protein